MVYSVFIRLEPGQSRLSVIVELEPELSCLGYWDVVSCLLCCFGKTVAARLGAIIGIGLLSQNKT